MLSSHPTITGSALLRRLKPAPETRQSYVLVCILLWSIWAYLISSRFVVSAVAVQGQSMAPTLHNGQTYMMNRWLYHFQSPDRGDLVVIHDPGYTDMAVKRVIAVGGERVEFKRGGVFIDGRELPEPYLSRDTATFPNRLTGLSILVPKDKFFVLGDNRANSVDSRVYGPIARDRIVGCVRP